MPIRLTCPGQPVSAKNHAQAALARTKTGRVIPRVRPGKAVTAWYARVVPALVEQWGAWGGAPLTGPVHITTHQFLEHDPDSPASPDGDNVQSAVWDALQKAGVLVNDRQVVGWAGSRQQGVPPRVEIEIRELTRRAA